MRRVYRAVIQEAGAGDFPLATMNVVPGYFHWKIEKTWNQMKSLAI